MSSECLSVSNVTEPDGFKMKVILMGPAPSLCDPEQTTHPLPTQLLIPENQLGTQRRMILFYHKLSSFQLGIVTRDEGSSDPPNNLCIHDVSTVCRAQVLFTNPSQSSGVPEAKGTLAQLLLIHLLPRSDYSSHLFSAWLVHPIVPCPQSHLSLVTTLELTHFS